MIKSDDALPTDATVLRPQRSDDVARMVELDRYRVVISLPSDESVEVRVVGFGQLDFRIRIFNDARIAQPTEYKRTPDDDVQVKGRRVNLCGNQISDALRHRRDVVPISLFDFHTGWDARAPQREGPTPLLQGHRRRDHPLRRARAGEL